MRKFCTQKQHMADEDGGVWRTSGKKNIRRWICARCAAVINLTPPTKRGASSPDTAETIRRG